MFLENTFAGLIFIFLNFFILILFKIQKNSLLVNKRAFHLQYSLKQIFKLNIVIKKAKKLSLLRIT